MDLVELGARLEALPSTLSTDCSLRSQSPLARSRSPTLPPDPELDDREEAEARIFLEQDGCPPCYPADPPVSAKDAKKIDAGVVPYWSPYCIDSGGPLCSQRNDWCGFRDFQQRVRDHSVNRFAHFTNAVRDRRQRHHLSEDVHLCLNPEEQTQVETWVEFQNYHLHIQESYEKEVQVEKEDLRAAREKLNAIRKQHKGIIPALPLPDFTTASSSVTERYFSFEHRRAENWVEGNTTRLFIAAQKMKLHKKHVLPWIEDERIKMVTTQPTSADAPDGIQSTPAGVTQQKKPVARSDLRKTGGNAPLRSFQPQKVTKPAKKARKFKQKAPWDITIRPTF